eukprot:TRINITY_DN3285_c0_g1_i8.p2 TRINITY_DN3285_c0_g1~~TRINITY_DN3285_c0_g1_i8.p2  ORF type:complete len:496 (+),score=136.18 TRINITY_DN3285_c0_g1_i8:36-1490(+)
MNVEIWTLFLLILSVFSCLQCFEYQSRKEKFEDIFIPKSYNFITLYSKNNTRLTNIEKKSIDNLNRMKENKMDSSSQEDYKISDISNDISDISNDIDHIDTDIDELSENEESNVSSDAGYNRQFQINKPLKSRMNYAASELGAKVIESARHCKQVQNILSKNLDRYSLCNVEEDLTFVIQLHATILPDKFLIQNLELYSSSAKNISLFSSLDGITYRKIDSFMLKPTLDEQIFSLSDTKPCNYIKLIVHDYYGNEAKTTITSLCVYGTTELEDFKDKLKGSSNIGEILSDEGVFETMMNRFAQLNFTHSLEFDNVYETLYDLRMQINETKEVLAIFGNISEVLQKLENFEKIKKIEKYFERVNKDLLDIINTQNFFDKYRKTYEENIDLKLLGMENALKKELFARDIQIKQTNDLMNERSFSYEFELFKIRNNQYYHSADHFKLAFTKIFVFAVCLICLSFIVHNQLKILKLQKFIVEEKLTHK